MKDWIEDNLAEAIIVAAILLLLIGVVGSAIYSHVENERLWNNGYCECDGKWVYVDSVTQISKSSDTVRTCTTYIYKCDRCGRMHEFDELR